MRPELRIEVGTVEGVLVHQALTKEGDIRGVVLAEQRVTVDLAFRVLGVRLWSGEPRLIEREREAKPAKDIWRDPGPRP